MYFQQPCLLYHRLFPRLETRFLYRSNPKEDRSFAYLRIFRSLVYNIIMVMGSPGISLGQDTERGRDAHCTVSAL